MVFVCQVGERRYPIALIRAFDLVVRDPNSEQGQVDADLGLCRLRIDPAKAYDSTVFIHLEEQLIRGALIVKDRARSSLHDDYLVVDTIDGDMFLRCRKHFPMWAT